MNYTRRSILAGVTGGLATGVLSTAAQSAHAAGHFDFTTDIVVLGLGGAGAATAISAADHGAQVLIVERQPKQTLRSNTRMSGGYIHSPKIDGDKKALKQYFTALFSGKYNQEPAVGEMPEISDGMAQHWTEVTPKLVKWLESLDPQLRMLETGGGAQYTNFPGAKQCSYAVYRASYPEKITNKTSTYQLPKSQTTEGEALWRALEHGIEQRSQKIKVLYEARGQKLITDSGNRVIGIEIQKGNVIQRILARKAVVLCSGGYEYGLPMRQAFLPGLSQSGWAFYGTTFNEGDGIRMGLEIGAGLTKAMSCAARMIWAPPVYVRGMRIGVTTNGIGDRHTIVVNSVGKRFCAENRITGGITNNFFWEKGTEQSLDTMRYDNTPAWLIFDSRLMRSKCLANLTRSTVGYRFIDYGREDNSDALRKGWILSGQTIEELAEKISKEPDNGGRMNVQSLQSTVEQFNADCALGKDSLFGRPAPSMKPIDHGPYYAIPLYAGGSNTKGGLTTDADKQVLTWDKKPIDGLYAVGEISCALNRGGAMLTECLVFGLVCGEKVAKLKARSLT